ncbi:MAG: tRNA isopentenyl-2-thiomethyl-A-37 hydroxylase MiaE [Cyanophyceae cyanobacterium]
MVPLTTPSAEVLPMIRFLEAPSSDRWLAQALSNLDEILLDHAQCERKAAAVALQLMAQYPSKPDLVRELTAIAVEELEHFEQVNRWLERRGIPLRAPAAPPYGSALRSQIRRQEPERLLDTLLVAGLIEARSHERLGLLGQHCPDPQLAAFYRGLMASEARHYGVYWLLADRYYDRAIVQARLGELARIEHQILDTLHPHPRIHS